MPDLPPDLPTTAIGWAGWIAAAIAAGINYVPKFFREQRGENRELDRLAAALGEERQLRKDAEVQLEAARQQIYALIREFSDIKASNARLELEVQNLTSEVAELKTELQQRNHP